MNQANRMAGFGTLFPTLAALTGPAQEFLTWEPAYRAPSGLRIRGGLGRGLRALLQAFEQHRERARVQRALARLDDRLLRDIGLSRADVGPEPLPPFVGLGEMLPRDRDSGHPPVFGSVRHGLWHL